MNPYGSEGPTTAAADLRRRWQSPCVAALLEWSADVLIRLSVAQPGGRERPRSGVVNSPSDFLHRHSILLKSAAACIRRVGLVCLFFTSCCSLLALEPWQEALARMPLQRGTQHLTKTNVVETLLESFLENEAAKALIFMPGATDEFYFFNRGNAQLTNAAPTLFDAIAALTNQTLIHVTFRPPFILLHSAEDSLEPVSKIEHEPTVERVRKKQFTPHILYADSDWDFILPTLSFRLDTRILPGKWSHDSSHFYRHNLAAHHLNGWEILEALAYAGKTQFTVQKKKITFEGDTRFRERPKVPENFEAIKELTR